MTDKFCLHPFNGIEIRNDGELVPCCKFKPELFDGWKTMNVRDSIDSYLNSKQLKEFQQQFINGSKPLACIKCWKDEEAGIDSKRQIDNQRWQAKVTDNKTKFISLPMGSLCNLKCRICTPLNSSSWIKEHLDLFGEKIPVQDWHKDPAIWKEIIELSQGCLELNIGGGEPFLYTNTEHIELINALVSTGNAKNINLHYHTNGTIFPSEDFFKLWEHFNWVDLQVSIDDIDKRFEYNRHPAIWEEVKSNLIHYRENVKQDSKLQLSISTTVSAFTVYYLEEFLIEMMKLRMPKPYLGRLNNPEYYRPGIFLPAAKVKIIDKLTSSRVPQVKLAANWVKQDDSAYWPKFVEMVQKHDQYRGEKFVDIFPELAIITDMK